MSDQQKFKPVYFVARALVAPASTKLEDHAADALRKLAL